MPSLIPKRKSKRLLAGRNREKGVPGQKLVSYCPMCPRMVSPGDPERDTHQTVSEHTRKTACPHGHEWNVL